ncbi:YdeI family protein [Sanguibacter sp. HDW7]|uniref:YdeI/OmpD-associated family protein n=1 Tax=Sanguibacter sp. HDW7 TaxID=2714931 RepID=UPI001407F35A|nr:YdeI/OmpD-associated family protein [Sanguibacter sp. HDW7]QIK83865.1 hypothetical protein G7063_09680 [Sanguibacter sp. HDW7]
MTDGPEPFVVPDAAAWSAWLAAHEDSSDGVWLVLAKKGTTTPTTLTYADALDAALCSGWIDGQKRSLDEAVFLQRFTPRRRRSMWSARNVEHVARLEAEGRMRARGRAEVDAARADGRWDRTYAGSATIEVPDDLAEALAATPGAAEAFATLNSANRYSVLHPVVTARPGATRERVVARAVERLVARQL